MKKIDLYIDKDLIIDTSVSSRNVIIPQFSSDYALRVGFKKAEDPGADAIKLMTVSFERNGVVGPAKVMDVLQVNDLSEKENEISGRMYEYRLTEYDTCDFDANLIFSINITYSNGRSDSFNFVSQMQKRNIGKISKGGINTDSSVKQIAENLDRVADDVHENSVNIRKNALDIKLVNADVSRLRVDVNKNTSDISILKTDVGNNADKINQLRTDVDANRDEIEILNSDVGEISGNVQLNTQKINDVEKIANNNRDNLQFLNSNRITPLMYRVNPLSPLNDKFSDLTDGVNQLYNLFKGSTTAKVYDGFSDFANDIRANYDKNHRNKTLEDFKIGTHILFRDVDISDLWVSGYISEEAGWIEPVYQKETDNAFAGWLELNGLESAKIDLSDYAKKIDLDEKVNIVPDVESVPEYGVYGYAPTNKNAYIGRTIIPDENSRTFIPTYGDKGNLFANSDETGSEAIDNLDKMVINKKYADDNYIPKILTEKAALGKIPYYRTDDSKFYYINTGYAAQGGTVPVRSSTGAINVGEPTSESHATTKKYVDDNFIPKELKLNESALTGEVVFRNTSSGNFEKANMSLNADKYTIPVRMSSGDLKSAIWNNASHGYTSGTVLNDSLLSFEQKPYMIPRYDSYGVLHQNTAKPSNNDPDIDHQVIVRKDYKKLENDVRMLSDRLTYLEGNLNEYKTDDTASLIKEIPVDAFKYAAFTKVSGLSKKKSTAKNYFNISGIEIDWAPGRQDYVKVNENSVEVGISDMAPYNYFWVGKFVDIFPELKVGDRVKLSADTNCSPAGFYAIDGMGMSWHVGEELIVNNDMVDPRVHIAMYGNHGGTATYSNINVEKVGEIAYDILESNKPTGISLFGANIWNERWKLGTYQIIDGTYKESTTQICCADFISVLPNTTYTRTAHIPSKETTSIWVLEYDKNRKYLKKYRAVSKQDGYSFTTSNETYFITFYFVVGYGNKYTNDLTIHLGSDIPQYTPYTYPTAISFPDEMINKAHYGEQFTHVDFKLENNQQRVEYHDNGIDIVLDGTEKMVLYQTGDHHGIAFLDILDDIYKTGVGISNEGNVGDSSLQNEIWIGSQGGTDDVYWIGILDKLGFTYDQAGLDKFKLWLDKRNNDGVPVIIRYKSNKKDVIADLTPSFINAYIELPKLKVQPGGYLRIVNENDADLQSTITYIVRKGGNQ